MIEEIDPSTNLIWSDTTNVTINSGVNDIKIRMRHLFSKVTVNVVSTGIARSTVSGISNVKMRGASADLDVKSGMITAHTDSAMLFIFPSSLPLSAPFTDSIFSTIRIVYTAGSNPTTVNVGSITLNSTTYNNLTTTFAKQLQNGYAYPIKIRFANVIALSEAYLPARCVPQQII